MGEAMIADAKAFRLVYTPGEGFDVIDAKGRRAQGLTFDEMLGQVVELMHPRLDGRPRYPMRTPKE